MAYQTFPWVRGSSQSYQKLIALQLPALKNRSFLDVGCNEGFFCGYAKFLGVKKVTGIDQNPEFLAMASALFPDCDFICQNWDLLAPEKYDVILNASAIHYASDQKKFLDLLMSRLETHGTLVLEIGVAPGEKNEFVEVTRSIDKRFFPTKAKLHEMLKDYAFKFVSHSVAQAGDPVAREVYHISHKLPYAILALDDPFSGKTFTIESIFRENIKRISGDVLYYEVANGSREAPATIKEIIVNRPMPLDCGLITFLICKNGLITDLALWLAGIAGHENFILDMFMPTAVRQTLAKAFEAAGFFVVNISLQKAVSRPRALEKAPKDSCYRYLKHLQKEFLINEKEYLEANPDVAQALAEGRITSALAHYIFCGKREKRKRSPHEA